jgi:hypothetical protein
MLAEDTNERFHYLTRHQRTHRLSTARSRTGSPKTRSSKSRVTAALASMVALVGMLATGPQHVRAAWQEVASILGLQGRPVAVSANVLSEHEIEGLDSMGPQGRNQCARVTEDVRVVVVEQSASTRSGSNHGASVSVGRAPESA